MKNCKKHWDATPMTELDWNFNKELFPDKDPSDYECFKCLTTKDDSKMYKAFYCWD